ncbi:MAG: mechanosensitive ion channel [Caldilineaceae bacterium]
MNGETPLQLLLDFYDRVLIVLARPVVQRQLVAFLLLSFAAWFVPFLLERLWRHRQRGQAVTEVDGSWQGRLLRLARGIEYTFFPILGLVFSEIAIALFQSQGWRTGLLEALRPVFWLLLLYRIIAGALFFILSDQRARRYTGRFLFPLLILAVFVLVNNLIGDTLGLGDIPLFNLFGASITLRSLATSVIVLYFFLVFAWIVRDSLSRALFNRRPDTDKGLANSVVVSTYYGIIALGILTAVSTIGFDLSTLTIVLGGLSVGISFGLQELVANFISGILLVFEQSLRPGDVIQVAGHAGTVDKLRLRSTVLKTLDNVEIFVPNKTLLTSTVETYTHTDRKVRVPVDVGVSYASTPEDVRTILLEVAARHGLVLKDPAPTVFFTGFGDSSLDFKLLIWINDPPRSAQISSDLRFMIFREFARRGIEIPFPQRDIHLRSDVRLASGADRQTASTSSDAAQSTASGQAAGTGKRTSSGQDAQEI